MIVRGGRYLYRCGLRQYASGIREWKVASVLAAIPDPKSEISALLEREKSGRKLPADLSVEVQALSAQFDRLRFPFEEERMYANEGKGVVVNVHENEKSPEIVQSLGGLKAKIKAKSGTTYEGQVDDKGLPHGFGEMETVKRDLYIGFFRAGKKEGKGRMMYGNGDTYDGEWKEDMRHGAGRYLTDSTMHDGEWKNDLKDGFGVCKTQSSETKGLWRDNELRVGHQVSPKSMLEYYGDFKNEEWTGQGKLSMPDGTLYIGTLEKGLPSSGGGVLYTALGQMFENDAWLHGRPNGKGRLIEEGVLIEGEWSDGELHQGTIKNRERGSVYSGELVNYIPNGKGEEKFADGSYFEGTFKNGFKEGAGRFLYYDNTEFTGHFVRDLKLGKGLLKMPSGETYQGDFKQVIDHDRNTSTLHGSGTYTKLDGSVYQGEFINGIPNGSGIYQTKDGKTKVNGIWKDGKLIQEIK